jgi:PAS domain-containing protein
MSNTAESATEELRQRKAVFDNIWMLAIVGAAATAFGSWRLGLVQLDISPIIWTLAALALAQFAATIHGARYTTAAELRTLSCASQLMGITAMGVAWHMFGGIQQPLFPAFIMLPLLAGGLILTFWQQQAALTVFLALLLSGIILAPDANHYIEERYGLTLVSPDALPGWIPKSRVAFTDMNTSPAYDLMAAGTLAVLAIALNAAVRAIIGLFTRFMDRTQALEGEVAAAQALSTQLIATAPSAEVLLVPSTGRILRASDRFIQSFEVSEPVIGQFLLDAVKFAYPGVIKRLMSSGGDEIQGAEVRGREVVLRVHAALIDLGTSQLVRLRTESCDEICWRGAVDAIDQPVFAVDSHGSTVFLNRSALAIFGPAAEGSNAGALFDAGSAAARWWDIAPLESARRMLDRNGRRYLASIRRERIAASVGELSFVHLHERDYVHAAANT